MHLPELICNCSNKEWESLKITKKKISYIESQVKVAPTSHGTVKIKHTILFTMIGGNVCNAATDTISIMRCYIFGSTSQNFKKLNKVYKENLETLKLLVYSLYKDSFFESLLHVALKYQ